MNQSNEEDNNGSSDLEIENEEQSKPPFHQEMLIALEVLRRGVQQYANEECTFDEHQKYEKCVESLLQSSKRQSKIDNFFTSHK